MDRLTVLFTKRRYNPVSWAIRWAVPRSRFALALSSHSMTVVGDQVYEATMLHGVRKVALAEALKGSQVVKETRYQVADLAAAIAFLEAQVGTPYDFPGALGLGLTPGRDWLQGDKWHCYELVAGALHAGGRVLFANLTHVGETALMAINP